MEARFLAGFLFLRPLGCTDFLSRSERATPVLLDAGYWISNIQHRTSNIEPSGPFARDLPQARPVTCTLAACGLRFLIGCSPKGGAGSLFCGLMIPMRSGMW